MTNKPLSLVVLLAIFTALSALAPTAAQAEECSYEDLHGAFTFTVDCDALQNYSGDFQEMKRLWLWGPLGEVHIMEAPEPYRTVELEVLMKTIGRSWTKRRNPVGVQEIKVAGMDGLVATRRRTRVASRTIVFKLADVNVTARLAVVAPRKEAEAALDKLQEAFLAGFTLN